MPYCENCGDTISNTTKFCTNCGSKVEDISEEENVQDETASTWNREEFIKKYPPNERSIITCPRCLGKGVVDDEDIERLSMQEYWVAGNCRYCDGIGKVNMKKLDSHAVADKDEDYKAFVKEITDSYDETWDENFEYDWEKFFGHLSKNSKKIYFGEAIPPKKIDAFIKKIKKSFDDEYIDECTYVLFYDDTLFGRGDDGILIATNKNDAILLYFSPGMSGDPARIALNDILRIENHKSSLGIVDLTGNIWDFHFSSCKTLLEAIIYFCEAYLECNIDE